MARSSPASTRVVELVNFLADHPGEAFRLSELARRLDFNKATAHGMLAVLVDARYLVYHPANKTFSLGPSIVSLAQATIADESKLAVIAQPEMEALAEATGSQCVLNIVAGDEFVIIASAGTPVRGQEEPVGYRGRLVPPLGMVFHAWGSDARVDTWLDRISADRTERARYRTLLAVVHERGYSASADQEQRQRLDAALDQLRDSSDSEIQAQLTALISDIAHGDHELLEIAPDRSYRVRQISAPIFDLEGAVRMGLLLRGLPELPGRELAQHATATVEAARRITKLVSGDDVLPSSL